MPIFVWLIRKSYFILRNMLASELLELEREEDRILWVVDFPLFTMEEGFLGTGQFSIHVYAFVSGISQTW